MIWWKLYCTNYWYCFISQSLLETLSLCKRLHFTGTEVTNQHFSFTAITTPLHSSLYLSNLSTLLHLDQKAAAHFHVTCQLVSFHPFHFLSPLVLSSRHRKCGCCCCCCCRRLSLSHMQTVFSVSALGDTEEELWFTRMLLLLRETLTALHCILSQTIHPSSINHPSISHLQLEPQHEHEETEWVLCECVWVCVCVCVCAAALCSCVYSKLG